MHCCVITEHLSLRSREALHLTHFCLAFWMLPGGYSRACVLFMRVGALIIDHTLELSHPFMYRTNTWSAVLILLSHLLWKKKHLFFIPLTLFFGHGSSDWLCFNLTRWSKLQSGRVVFAINCIWFEFHCSYISSAFSYPPHALRALGYLLITTLKNNNIIVQSLQWKLDQ